MPTLTTTVTASAPVGGGDSCEMYYTSGSTGRPKGVMLTHKMVVKHALGCMLMHRITGADVWGHIAPMFHLVDAYAMFAITWVGGKHVLVPTFSASAVDANIADKITIALNEIDKGNIDDVVPLTPLSEIRIRTNPSMVRFFGLDVSSMEIDNSMAEAQ